MTEYKPKVCPACGKKTEGHPECEGCHAAIGPGHVEEFVREYRGHVLCRFCRNRWENMEIRTNRTVSWEEFKSPNADYKPKKGGNDEETNFVEEP